MDENVHKIQIMNIKNMNKTRINKKCLFQV